ncbi:MAG: ACT domain-containing protein [Conexivisphaerales archaeon]|jgi:predicted hydrocarbon binding protein
MSADNSGRPVYWVQEPQKGAQIFEMFITLKNQPGALNRVTTILAEHGVNVLKGQIFTEGDKGYFAVFVACTSSALIDEITSKIKALEDVIDIKHENSYVDVFMYPLSSGSQRALIFSANAVYSSYATLEKVLGLGPARVIVYNSGYQLGYELASFLRKTTGITSCKESVDLFVKAFRASGLGVVSTNHFREEPFEAEIKVRNFLILDNPSLPYSPVLCDLAKGIVSGAFAFITARPVMAEEVTCQLKGNDSDTYWIREANQHPHPI